MTAHGTATIKFRAKRDGFGGGMGYKVPTLTPNHVSINGASSSVDTTIKLARDMTIALKRFGVTVPGVVWEENTPDQWRSDTSAWTITPVGNGFMADVSLTVELVRA